MVAEESHPLSARSGNSVSPAKWLRLQKTLSPRRAVLVEHRTDVDILETQNKLSSGCKMPSSMSVVTMLSTSSQLGTAVGCRSYVDVLEPKNCGCPREALAETAVVQSVKSGMPVALKAAVVEKGLLGRFEP